MSDTRLKKPEVMIIKLAGNLSVSRENCRKAVERAILSYSHRKDKPQLQFDEYGKPSMPGSKELAFSYAHSKSVLAIMVYPTTNAVGIDTENDSRTNEIADIAKYAFSKEELIGLKRENMLFLWCLKEAAVKQLGKGFIEADPSEYTIKIHSNSYKLSLSQFIVQEGYFVKKRFGNDLVVACSSQRLTNICFSDANFIDLIKDK